LIDESSLSCSEIFDSIDCLAEARRATNLLCVDLRLGQELVVQLDRVPERP